MQKPRYSRPARRDYFEIANYIARDNPVAAGRVVDRIEAECLRITEQPDRGNRHEDLPARCLYSPVGKYLIIYQVDDEGVMILRIVHGARDLTQLLPESP